MHPQAVYDLMIETNQLWKEQQVLVDPPVVCKTALHKQISSIKLFVGYLRNSRFVSHQHVCKNGKTKYREFLSR